MLWLLGIGKWLREAAGALFGAVVRYPLQFALIAALCLSGWLWRGKQAALVERDEARAELDMARRQFAAASEANEQAQREQVAKLEAKLTDAAKESANVESQIRVVYRDRTAAYADRMRQDRVCERTANPPGKDQPAPVDNSADQEAILVSRTDLDILAENTARLEAAHRWAKTLMDDGTAEVVKAGVPEVGF